MDNIVPAIPELGVQSTKKTQAEEMVNNSQRCKELYGKEHKTNGVFTTLARGCSKLLEFKMAKSITEEMQNE